MNPLPPVNVHTGPPAGDSSLSSHNDEEENRSVDSAANLSHYSQSDHSRLDNPEDLYATTIAITAPEFHFQSQYPQQHQHEQQGLSAPTPRYSNRTRTLSNSNSTTPAIADSNNVHDNSGPLANQLTIRITTRPIMSWSPQVIHADGSSHTMSIDLPEEFARNNGTVVITQKGWKTLYHIIATTVAKNTSESILLFWLSGFLLMVMALILLFGVVRGIASRVYVLMGVIGVTSLFGILHTVVRRIRVHIAVRKCVEECFYDAEAEAFATAVAANAATNAAANAATSIGIDTEQQQPPQNTYEGATNERDRSMGGVLDGLQELEDVANVDGAATGDTSGGFSRALRQRLNSHSSTHSHTNPSTNAIGNQQRLNTGGGDSTVTSLSNMIFNEEGPRRNRAVSRDGMYCVHWNWEYLGMDAVVKISWE
jgi:hypothetical protein